MRAQLSPCVVALLLAGCGQGDSAPGLLGESVVPQVAFLVHNEVWSIRLDGTERVRLGTAGYTRFRTGWPRYLADGRIGVLGDDNGGIFPYVGFPEERRFQRLPQLNVTMTDSLCGVTIDGAPRLVFTETPFIELRTTLHRVNIEEQLLEPVDWQTDGLLLNPAPYADGYVLVSRLVPGQSRIDIVHVAGTGYEQPETRTIATVDSPYYAASPVRLLDGRVAFLRIDARNDFVQTTGEVWIVPAGGGRAEPSGLTDVIAITTAGDKLVYEAAGSDYVSDILYTDLNGPPVNLTNTPFISEHLGWSD